MEKGGELSDPTDSVTAMTYEGFMSEHQVRQARLLEWLSGFAGEIPDLAPFYDNDPGQSAKAQQDLEALLFRGWVRDASGMGGLESLAAETTAEGRATVDDMRTRRADTGARRWACRSAIVTWLASSDASVESGKSMSLTGLAASPYAMFFADRFTAREIDQASAWLHRHGLIDGLTVEEAIGPVRALLTGEGLRCADRFDADICAYLADKEAREVSSITWNVTGQQVQVATGDNARQTMNIGTTVDQMALAIHGMVEILKAFDLGGDDNERALLVDEAVRDIRADAPSGTGVRKLGAWVRGRLAAGTNAAVAAAVTALVTGLEQDAAHLVQAIVHAV